MSEPIPTYLDRSQVMRLIGLGETETDRAFATLATYRVTDRRVRVRHDELVEWMETHRQEAAA